MALFTQTSPYTATTLPVVIRDGDLVRLVFVPEIVKNLKNPDACVKGTFVYQRRKKKEDPWENVRDLDLKKLKAGEGAQWALHSEEVLTFLRAIAPLYRTYTREKKLPIEHVEYVPKTPKLSALMELGEQGLNELLEQDPTNSPKLLRSLLAWLSKKQVAQAMDIVAELQGLESSQINSIIRLASLRNLQKLWAEHSTNGAEAFWQSEFGKAPFALSLVLPFQIIVLDEKAYLGGKSCDDTGGSLVDFLVSSKLSQNCGVIELKTPVSALLGKEYRQNVFSISDELSGAVVQTQNYLERLTVSSEVRGFLPANYSAVRPRGVVICGSRAELDSEAKKRSFDLFRNGLTDLHVVTYDELFERVDALIRVLTE